MCACPPPLKLSKCISSQRESQPGMFPFVYNVELPHIQVDWGSDGKIIESMSASNQWNKVDSMISKEKTMWTEPWGLSKPHLLTYSEVNYICYLPYTFPTPQIRANFRREKIIAGPRRFSCLFTLFEGLLAFSMLNCWIPF